MCVCGGGSGDNSKARLYGVMKHVWAPSDNSKARLNGVMKHVCVCVGGDQVTTVRPDYMV